MSLRDDILNASDLSSERVEVPEWNQVVWIKMLSGTERDDFEASCLEEKRVGGKSVTKVNLHNLRAKLLVWTLVDEKGERIFDQTNIEALGRKSAKAINRLFEVAQRLNGLTDEEVDELTKN